MHEGRARYKRKIKETFRFEYLFTVNVRLTLRRIDHAHVRFILRRIDHAHVPVQPEARHICRRLDVVYMATEDKIYSGAVLQRGFVSVRAQRPSLLYQSLVLSASNVNVGGFGSSQFHRSPATVYVLLSSESQSLLSKVGGLGWSRHTIPRSERTVRVLLSSEGQSLFPIVGGFVQAALSILLGLTLPRI